MRMPGRMAAAMVAVLVPTVVFADNPAGKEIAEVIVQGNRIHTREQIVAQIDTRAGAKYDPKTALEDVNRLLALGWFPPSGIGVSTQTREDSKVIVYFNVKELQNKISEIIYRGAAHLSKDELEKLTNLKVGMPMNPAVIQQARLAILRSYQEHDRHCATVTILEGGKEQDKRVFFDIAEGPKTKISGIDYQFFGPSSGDISTGRMRRATQQLSRIPRNIDRRRLQPGYCRAGHCEDRRTLPQPRLSRRSRSARVNLVGKQSERENHFPHRGRTALQDRQHPDRRWKKIG